MRLERYAVAAALLLAACSDPSEPDNPSPFIGRWDFDPAIVLDCPESTPDVIVRRLLIEANGPDALAVDVVLDGLLPYTLEIDIENPTGRSVALADTIPPSPFSGFTVSASFDLAGTLQPGDSLITGTAEASVTVSGSANFTCAFPEGPFQARRAP